MFLVERRPFCVVLRGLTDIARVRWGLRSNLSFLSQLSKPKETNQLHPLSPPRPLSPAIIFNLSSYITDIYQNCFCVNLTSLSGIKTKSDWNNRADNSRCFNHYSILQPFHLLLFTLLHHIVLSNTFSRNSLYQNIHRNCLMLKWWFFYIQSLSTSDLMW